MNIALIAHVKTDIRLVRTIAFHSLFVGHSLEMLLKVNV